MRFDLLYFESHQNVSKCSCERARKHHENHREDFGEDWQPRTRAFLTLMLDVALHGLIVKRFGSGNAMTV